MLDNHLKGFSKNELLNLFVVNYDDGHLIWRTRPIEYFINSKLPYLTMGAWNKKFSGKLAGYVHTSKDKSYNVVKINGKAINISNIIYFLYYGEISNDKNIIIDHIDGDSLNDSINNLRQISQMDNTRNMIKCKNNVGYKGVKLSKSSKKYEARISVDGKYIHIGTYDDAETAHEAYKKQKNILHQIKEIK